ncbi:uncharacterized protein DCS_07555 [Drechmeria coniospora]|uniref:RED-like N-terminal domain-containing protein n=1 Tax=Drechmeria coniospora TaxID=98403 RepID=A0A151GEV1_DRECN|nr:uncharacterized protein DCS_07555 [Drechmeria coniospora]KYK55592.1 uncharacterized protein DCS_07555 [Drechmeria coniospora]
MEKAWRQGWPSLGDLVQRNAATRPQGSDKKTSAPKGVKLATGYVDRVKEREYGTDDREEQLKALEEALRKEEMDRETYDKRRFEIAGGTLDSTHLVKGLDFKLLDRVRRGEDVYGNKKTKEKQASRGDDEPNDDDLDDEFSQLEQQEVQTIAKEKVEKRGQMSTVSLEPGKKRTRNQILAELKAAREAAKAQQTSSLGSKFKKIGVKQQAGTRIERDGKGREVMIIVDEDGNEKRKVRRLQPQEKEESRRSQQDMMMPDPTAKPLGMEVPEQYRRQEGVEEDDDVDIFDDVGDDYDPLAGIEEADSDSDDVDDTTKTEAETATKEMENSASSTEMESMPQSSKPAATHNYFKDSKTGLLSAQTATGPSMSDPEMMAAIKKAAALRPVESEEVAKSKEQAAAMEERRKKLLEMSARDDDDLDLGFGTSRFEDDEDLDDDRVKLSAWGGGGDEDGDGRRGGQAKRKRGPKKRKGDGNNAADVLRVMEQRKKAGGSGQQ